ncbi:MAG TPA: rhomboid family intramembrane serine protease [Candidatus Saccharimonadales bacterium]|jgi:membrane associated rhomboid family serine protease|nr:rhomboid family intramembrane serine protease [Candidatus Saccharimonadales bacterium]
MLIPLRHENMRGRRWPLITFGIIALNVVIFLGTHGTIDRQEPELGQVKVHLILLAAMHPELNIPDKAEKFVFSIQNKNAVLWKEAKNPGRSVFDTWDAKIRMQNDSFELQQEMDSLGDQYAKLSASSILGKYAFIPAHQTFMGLIAANFLHGGWLHLIGNMWFLWLTGAVLEDTWGRMIYSAFYLIAGILAFQVHAMVNAGSFTPTIGASGAIAGLMGAFLVRFPKTKIEMGYLLLFRFYKFKMAAYWLLPLWLLTEILYGSVSGQSSGVAHWAHVGGFAFGALIAVAVQKTGLEQMAEQGIQEKISWVSHPLLADASEQIEKKEFDQAAASLQKLLVEKPDSIDGYRMLQRTYWEKNDLPAQRDALVKLLALEIKANDAEGALQTFQDFRIAGGEKLPAPTWLEFCRVLETQPDISVAAEEYNELAKTYPDEKQGLLAQMAAGRIYLKRMNRPADALHLYEAAMASSIPHADWQTTIDRGIAEAKKALLSQIPAATTVS